MDRDPQELTKSLSTNPLASRVVLLGDAAHSMSPFKGQGANQALTDGPLLGSWLQKASLSAAIKGFMREMAQRTGPKVRQSRDAAAFLHSPEVLHLDHSDFNGVPRDRVRDVLSELGHQKIGAWLGSELDNRIESVLRDMNLLEYSRDVGKTKIDVDAETLALSLAAAGDSMGLRNLSLDNSTQIRSARDSQGRSCLHLAVQGGHVSTCRWLLTEAFMSSIEEDSNGLSARSIAVQMGDDHIISLFQTDCL
mmetsp:Transcript_17589/g.29836  ORF Transcript_17589/g.29836 Transcript_17589/m.29836 type:complete len:251 (+) Transcript_17589:529-1281(+)